LARGTAACAALMPGIRAVPFGHMGDGNIHFNLMQPVGMDPAAFLAQDLAQGVQLGEFGEPARHRAAIGVGVQNDTLGNFQGIGSHPIGKVDVEAIGFGEIFDFHGLNLRSGNALWIVISSESVITRRNRPSSSGTLPQNLTRSPSSCTSFRIGFIWTRTQRSLVK
jgi:hypothetical protein